MRTLLIALTSGLVITTTCSQVQPEAISRQRSALSQAKDKGLVRRPNFLVWLKADG
ncbi:MAG: hypothetical protein HYZ50_12115 [Deltaproteobacteria bacterium]|nr:hypothetical protein [Deltaproteobacteria bacterium]